MKLLLIILLSSQFAYAQNVSVKDIINLYSKRTDSSALIAKINSMGFTNVSYASGRTNLEGTTAVMMLFKTDGVIDAMEYRTHDSTVYNSWKSSMEKNGFMHLVMFKSDHYKTYLSEKYMVQVYNEDIGYSFMITKRP